ncbi:MAG TPA: hypothetical protein EYH50_02595 [Pyrodictium delaneyi]|uniref:Polymerase nucleotidyl transferase domain-containing protein n=1 Tax=Pyrodictium delaneyi TaxID=1273541 RepID=A0A832ZTH9_9CREN|nr:hypothetical protein [Pyrodictium delaneyi]
MGYTDLVGVTGGLAYNPYKASDIDIVVYGAHADRVYQLLVKLRREGITTPYRGVGHSWSSSDIELNRALNKERVLIGYINGFEYNVKLVPCTKPAPCIPFKTVNTRVKVRGVVRHVSPYTVPAVYKLELYKPLTLGTKSYTWVYLFSHRLRYTEILEGMAVEAKGVLEEFEGLVRLVPDHSGYVKPLYRPSSS